MVASASMTFMSIVRLILRTEPSHRTKLMTFVCRLLKPRLHRLLAPSNRGPSVDGRRVDGRCGALVNCLHRRYVDADDAQRRTEMGEDPNRGPRPFRLDHRR